MAGTIHTANPPPTRTSPRTKTAGCAPTARTSAAHRHRHGPGEEDGLAADPVDDERHARGARPAPRRTRRRARGRGRPSESPYPACAEQGRHRREETRPRHREAQAGGVHRQEPPMRGAALRAVRGRRRERGCRPASGSSLAPREPAQEEHRARAHEHPRASPPAPAIQAPSVLADPEAQDRHALEGVREAAPPGGRRRLEELGEDREERGRGADPHDEAGHAGRRGTPAPPRRPPRPAPGARGRGRRPRACRGARAARSPDSSSRGGRPRTAC